MPRRLLPFLTIASDMKVTELGERELIKQLVLPVLARFHSNYLGDDCAVLPISPSESLLITTDISSTTSFLRILQVGSFMDLGHLFATMSMSDIAAMGGRPLALVAACSFEPEFTSESFSDLIEGIALGCQENGAKYVGGDTKEGPRLQVVTTAVGLVNSERILSRSGAKIGDLVCVSGRIGTALHSYIKAANAKSIDQNVSVIRPKARVEFAAFLAEQGLATSCIDMSDGPIAAAQTLGEVNHLQLNLNIDALDLASPPAENISANVWKSLLLNVGGDYELMFTTDIKHLTEIERLGAIVCGTVDDIKKSAGVTLTGLPEADLNAPWEHFRSTAQIVRILKSLV